MKLLRPLLQGFAFGLVFVDVVDDGLFYEQSLRNSTGLEFGDELVFGGFLRRRTIALIVDCRLSAAICVVLGNPDCVRA